MFIKTIKLKSTLLILTLAISATCYAQNVKLNSGRICISNDKSFDHTYEEVIADLKGTALRKAGVKERIMEFANLTITETEKEFREVFYSNFLSTINGTIKNFQVTDVKRGYDKELDCYFLDLSAKAKVKKYKTKTDPKFQFIVSGIKNGYKNNEGIQFTVEPYLDAYVTIFYIGEKEASRIYPFEGNDSFIPMGSQKIFNQFGAYTDQTAETGRILIVLTKEKIPFVCSEKDESGFYTITSTDEIFNWLLLIEPDQRTQSYHEIGIVAD